MLKVSSESILEARNKLKGSVVKHTPLFHSLTLSNRYKAHIFLKREDLQVVRSYKIRGAYNKMNSLSKQELAKGVVCVSAGNHAQGVAYACQHLKIQCTVFMPVSAPVQKVNRVRMFGKDIVEIILTGNTFDDAHAEADRYSKKERKTFIHPFNDIKVIEGQGTIGVEVIEDINQDIDYLFLPIGGGGLAAGLGTYIKEISPKTHIIGVEPKGAASMKCSIEAKKIIKLKEIDNFVDGAATKQVGKISFSICQKVLDNIVLVPEGKVCTTILDLYNEEAIVVEPAGALSIASLDIYKDQIKGKVIVCIISGSNNDIARIEEIKERSLLYEGLKGSFAIRFSQNRSLRNFLIDNLEKESSIVYFKYKKIANSERGIAIVSIEVKKKEILDKLIEKLNSYHFDYELLDKNSKMYDFLF